MDAPVVFAPPPGSSLAPRRPVRWWLTGLSLLLSQVGCGNHADGDEQGSLCAPCEISADCGAEADLCLVNNETGAHFCGRDCTSAACPDGYDCMEVPTPTGGVAKQCAPPNGSCETGSGGTTTRPPTTPTPPAPPPPGDCDPSFRRPFCTNDRIIGFEHAEPADPTEAEVREYSLAAVNHIRSRTCLPPLALDECLNQLAEEALAANSGHGYFIEHCMSAAGNYGQSCECNWSQENIGMASGSSRTWADGVQVPLCGMMEEDFGTGHRSNIEHPDWKRLGVGIDWNSNGASWHHEFGCDASLPSCPR